MNSASEVRTGSSLEPFELTAFKQMLLIRTFEAKCLALSRLNPPMVVGSIHLCAGQEAIPVGARAALRPTDQVVATYRGHGWALESGITPRELMLEIAHRAEGINGGRAGSAYIMAPERGFVGENSIVGAGGPIATGVALAYSRQQTDDVVVVSFGDGAMSQGALHESLIFAAAQNLPVVFICENNGWAEMTATTATLRTDNLADRAHGYGIPSTTANGNDPLIVRACVQAAVDRARIGQGPSFIEFKTSRLWGHYNRDMEHYRPTQDKQKAQMADPLVSLQQWLLERNYADVTSIAEIKAKIECEIDTLADEIASAALPDSDTATEHMYADVKQAVPAGVAATAEEMAYWKAINTAMRTELCANKNVLIYGEDVGKAGGIFGVTRNLQQEFGAERVFDMPIAESAILGSAVGAAIMGMRPIVEIMWGDFMLVALDQLVNQAANVRYITRGAANAPLVVRLQQGVTPGSCAQHSQSLEALLFHIPGLRLGLPATPQDAYDMLRAAVAGRDPTILIEARALYLTKGMVTEGLNIERGAGAVRRRSGNDAAIITWGTSVQLALEAAEQLEQDGLKTSVLDLRWLSPLDEGAIDTVVRDCGGRVLILHEANRTGGVGGEIAARIAERHWQSLQHPIRRIATPDVRIPAAPNLQRALLPSVQSVIDAARDLCQHLR